MEPSIRDRVHYIDTAAELDSYRLAEQLDVDPRKIPIAMHVAGGMSRGSAISATENMTAETLARVDGELVAVANRVEKFDFGQGAVDSFQVTLPDLITIWRATGVPKIETFLHVTGGEFLQGDLSVLPDGPREQERLDNRYKAVVEVTDADGAVVRSLLDTVNGYLFTAIAVEEAGRRVLAGEALAGFQTPTGLFGNGFAETIADTTILDV